MKNQMVNDSNQQEPKNSIIVLYDSKTKLDEEEDSQNN